jgi:phosphoribosylformylglycinamidine synthase subunit PurS
MKAKVIVMPKAAVLDPQGNAVRDAMRHLGMPEVRSVRIGKYMEIDIEGQNGDFESRLHRLCRDLLSNPVIEDYELQKAAASANQPLRKATTSREATARQGEGGGRKKTSNSESFREQGAQRPTRLRKATARQASNSDKSRAGVQRPKSKTKRTRLRPATARQARRSS